MKPPILFALVLALSYAGGVLLAADDKKQELSKLKGEWELTAEVTLGRSTLDETGHPGVTIDEEKLILRLHKKNVTYCYKIDPSQPVKEIDLTAEGGSPVRSIYQIDGDELWICLGRIDSPRPDSFVTTRAPDRTLYKFKRRKAPDEETGKELKKLVGTWQAVSVRSRGRPFPEDRVKDVKLELTQDKWVMHWGTESTGVFEIDIKASPKTIDIKHWNGDFAGAKSLGIYKLEDDELTICYDAESQGRPSEFESPAKTQRKLLTFKRVKP